MQGTRYVHAKHENQLFTPADSAFQNGNRLCTMYSVTSSPDPFPAVQYCQEQDKSTTFNSVIHLHVLWQQEHMTAMNRYPHFSDSFVHAPIGRKKSVSSHSVCTCSRGIGLFLIQGTEQMYSACTYTCRGCMRKSKKKQNKTGICFWI